MGAHGPGDGGDGGPAEEEGDGASGGEAAVSDEGGEGGVEVGEDGALGEGVVAVGHGSGCGAARAEEIPAFVLVERCPEQSDGAEEERGGEGCQQGGAEGHGW